MRWEENRLYRQQHGRKCLVCGQSTREQTAPLGIVSGSVACCVDHDDRAIVSAYLRWAAQEELESFRNGVD